MIAPAVGGSPAFLGSTGKFLNSLRFAPVRHTKLLFRSILRYSAPIKGSTPSRAIAALGLAQQAQRGRNDFDFEVDLSAIRRNPI